EKNNFISSKDNKDLFEKGNIREDDLRNKDTVRALSSNLSTDFMINLSTDHGDKEAILKTISEIVKENNQRGEYDTDETKKLRKNYIRLNKNKIGKEGEFNKLYEGAEDNEQVTQSVKDQIETGEIKVEHLIKISSEDLQEKPELTKTIALKFDLKQFKDLYAQNSRAAREVIKKVKELANDGNNKMDSLLEDVKHSQMGYLVDSEQKDSAGA
ncbi:MAG TPA: hypothetical protein VJ895_01250, partial [Candidatus Nanoarchaeia archaeon]|nr:hypothetical protein [Candidatus Nanoarchaeia archaeon]